MIRLALAALLLAGCATDGAACKELVSEALASAQGAFDDYDEPMRQCSVIELEAAAHRYPESFDGLYVPEWLRSRCAVPPDISDAPACEGI